MRSGASEMPAVEHRSTIGLGCGPDREHQTATHHPLKDIIMNPTQANSWEHLQQAIDAEIKSLEESIRALKHRRNAVSPISSLPPEVFATIFSLTCLPGIPSLGGRPEHNLARIHLSHVCHQWREIALNQPLLWSHVDFDTLSLAGSTEMLIRAKSVPLYLEVKRAPWCGWEIMGSDNQVMRFQTELQARFQTEFQTCIPHTCFLSINAKSQHLRSTLELLVSPAPILKNLSLVSRGVSNCSNRATWDEVFIPEALFEGIAPSLFCLELRNCDISWKSPLLKGLKYLKIVTPSERTRPNLAVWLDALNEMSQLQMLTLHSASPIALPPPFAVERTVTLPSLTHLDISASVGECALALAHLDLPAITCLCIILNSHQNDSNVWEALPYVARHAHGSQDIQPLQSILISGYSTDYLNILAWPVPNIDVEVHDPPTLLGATVPTRVAISFRSEGWSGNVRPEILDAVVTALPLDSLVMLAAQDLVSYAQDSMDQFWLRHLPKWPLLRRVRLSPFIDRGFLEALQEDNGGRKSPLFPSLTELVIVQGRYNYIGSAWTCLCDALTKRVEQGIPLEILDLRLCYPSPYLSAEVRTFSEIVVNVLEPNLQGGPEEELDASKQMARRMMSSWELLARGPFAEDDNTNEEDDEDEDEDD